MGLNILIAGGAGGGTLLAHVIDNIDSLFSGASISALVRTQEQATYLRNLDIPIIVDDFEVESKLVEALFLHEIDIVVNTANSFDGKLVSTFLKALGHRHKSSSRSTYFIHSSVAAVFSIAGGWPDEGMIDDASNLYLQEKSLGYSHPVHDVNKLVVEEAKQRGVTALVVVVPIVYGKGKGEGKKVSAFLPTIIRTGITDKAVHKFDQDGNPAATHVSDLVSLYSILLEKISQGEIIPVGEKGYYFGAAHNMPTWETMRNVSNSLKRRGLVTEAAIKTWSSDEMAAEHLQFPLPFVRTMGGTYSSHIISNNAYALGWEPKWDREKFLQSIDDEVAAVLESGLRQDSRFYSL